MGCYWDFTRIRIYMDSICMFPTRDQCLWPMRSPMGLEFIRLAIGYIWCKFPCHGGLFNFSHRNKDRQLETWKSYGKHHLYHPVYPFWAYHSSTSRTQGWQDRVHVFFSPRNDIPSGWTWCLAGRGCSWTMKLVCNLISLFQRYRVG